MERIAYPWIRPPIGRSLTRRCPSECDEDESEVRLSEKPPDVFRYVYDFIDDRVHLIRVLEPIEWRFCRSDVMDGIGYCPCEDCGGAGMKTAS